MRYAIYDTYQSGLFWEELDQTPEELAEFEQIPIFDYHFNIKLAKGIRRTVLQLRGVERPELCQLCNEAAYHRSRAPVLIVTLYVAATKEDQCNLLLACSPESLREGGAEHRKC